MLPSYFLAVTASIFLTLITASLTPVCVPSTGGYLAERLNNLCEGLSKEKFHVYGEVYGVPAILLSFIPAKGADQCDQAGCLPAFGTLIQSCKCKYLRFTE
jgi:hypothetical protein